MVMLEAVEQAGGGVISCHTPVQAPTGQDWGAALCLPCLLCR